MPVLCSLSNSIKEKEAAFKVQDTTMIKEKDCSVEGLEMIIKGLEDSIKVQTAGMEEYLSKKSGLFTNTMVRL